MPRGDTLKRLATALDINLQDLTEEESNLRTDKTYLLLINFSALSFLIFPLLGAIIPLVIWLTKRNEIMHMDNYGKRILNFQISWLIVNFAVMALFTSIFFTRLLSISGHETLPQAGSMIMISTMQLMLACKFVLSAYNVIMIVVNAIRCNNNNEVSYRPAIKFFG